MNLARALTRSRTPDYDFEGRGVRRLRRLRRLQAAIACLDLGAMALLALAGPVAFRIHALF